MSRRNGGSGRGSDGDDDDDDERDDADLEPTGDGPDDDDDDDDGPDDDADADDDDDDGHFGGGAPEPEPGRIPLAMVGQGIARLLAIGQRARATELATNLVAERPDDPHAFLWLARVHLDAGRIEAADAALAEARRLAPDDATVNFELARLRFVQGRFAEAELAALASIRQDPDDGDGHRLLAAIWSSCERHAPALAAVEHALALDPDDGSAHAQRSRLLLLVHPSKWQISEDAARRALALDPDDADAHAIPGHVCLRAGHPQQAETHLKTALELRPGHALAMRGLAETVMARKMIYRPFMRYQLFMDRVSVGTRIAVMLGLWAIANSLIQYLNLDPATSDHAATVTYVYLALCAYTWFAAPITRRMLRAQYPWLDEVA